MLTIALLLAAAAPQAAVIDDAGTITVTASRLPDLEAAALACAAGGCPTRQDIAVSVAWASALFDAGRYRDAKGVLTDAVDRNRRAARAEPVAVARLYEAQATLATHEGDQRMLQRATQRSADTLMVALPPDAGPRLQAEFRLADWQYRNRLLPAAYDRYADIGTRAAAAGDRSLAAATVLRRASIRYFEHRHAEGAALLTSLDDPGQSPEVRRAALATAALASEQAGLPTAVGQARSLLAADPGAEPLLISQPPLPRPTSNTVRDPIAGMFDFISRGDELKGLRWADIGYRIKPDGSVGDVTVLRSSRDTGWTAPLVGWVAARRYAPLAAGPAGVCRVDRFTFTANYDVPIGSLVRRRMRDPRYETMAMALPVSCG